ncbi:MAG: 16S rRNA pseudouridine(516) synthase [Spirochaetes bacterium GWD1_61_31]|nr:MAG: 16S rRNA pseudouridine(516) synthase [Spirochaetes bacterium GWB1_60_80]OHD35327.1 MAG: 16S rRNA pseudouridine(516) synthase [Spirochaetes bacterium GWC1_61_12]OHD37286.1 MAG: 16S rRNA pseudouridine(516) synthase [Spirochaetes bacterium GWD1_61_31]OHD44983.1 MAG: 16S rRNA pseudouridine(516) synthase [Spirochaetes bacterium GWE1_60_18]OHD60092.1 MAG: 16S rRNA pseudouridine(516) synthase [Spirochaetes bacterium GWF1_60_12]HAP43662.1 16S rRNA pseudouridine(516) synthase [Spirochaetaceae b
MKTISLDRILQSQGIGSRKTCRAIIADGLVSIGGHLVDNWSAEFDPAGLYFSLDDQDFEYLEHLYLAMNKPTGYECSRKPVHHPSVLSLLPERFVNRDIQPVGRLDQDTGGLLLLSDDGQFIHAQSSPKKHQAKTYRVGVDRPVEPALLALLLAGVQLLDEPGPLRALECVQTGSHSLELSIDQGKYHQVRRMIAAAGNHCTALARDAIGGLTLAALGLAPGEWCLLSAAQRQLLVPV